MNFGLFSISIREQDGVFFWTIYVYTGENPGAEIYDGSSPWQPEALIRAKAELKEILEDALRELNKAP